MGSSLKLKGESSAYRFCLRLTDWKPSKPSAINILIPIWIIPPQITSVRVWINTLREGNDHGLFIVLCDRLSPIKVPASISSRPDSWICTTYALERESGIFDGLFSILPSGDMGNDNTFG